MHLIEKHILTIACTSEPLGKEVQAGINHVMTKKLYPELELLLDRYSITNFTRIIDTIAIELPPLSKKNWKKEFIRHTLIQVEEYLKLNDYSIREDNGSQYDQSYSNNLLHIEKYSLADNKNFSKNKNTPFPDNHHPYENNSFPYEHSNNPFKNSNFSHNDTSTYISHSSYTESLFFEYLSTGNLSENSLYRNLGQVLSYLEKHIKNTSHETVSQFIEKLFHVFTEKPESLIRYIFNTPEKLKKTIQEIVSNFPINEKNTLLDALIVGKYFPVSRAGIKLWIEFVMWIFYFYKDDSKQKFNLTIVKEFSDKYFYLPEERLSGVISHLQIYTKTSKKNNQLLQEFLQICYSVLKKEGSTTPETLPAMAITVRDNEKNDIIDPDMNSHQEIMGLTTSNEPIGDPKKVRDTRNENRDIKDNEDTKDTDSIAAKTYSDVTHTDIAHTNSVQASIQNNFHNPDNSNSPETTDSVNNINDTYNKNITIPDNIDKSRTIDPELKKILQASNTNTSLPPMYQDISRNTFYIENAGLVILHPFLTTLFEQTDLYTKQGWTSDRNRQKAVLLTQYLITGQAKIFENELQLNKLLCGFPAQEVLNTKIRLTKKDKSLCHDLLLAVINYWSMLKDTSPEALRETFLIRKAKMLVNNTVAELWVEQKGVDILLQQLPWGIGMIKTPWMEDFLQCNWN